MHKNIANFLKESPEWVESWLNISVKAKYIQNPLMIPEIMANVLNYLPLGQHRGICQPWDKEIDHAQEAREKTLKHSYFLISSISMKKILPEKIR